MLALIIIILVDLAMLYYMMRVGLKDEPHPVSLTSPSIEAMKARIPAPAPVKKVTAPEEVVESTDAAATATSATSASADADE